MDEAARRRFTKRIYVPLPDDTSRRELLRTRMRGERCSLSPHELETIVAASDGYSGAVRGSPYQFGCRCLSPASVDYPARPRFAQQDLTSVCVEAAWAAMRASLTKCGSAPGKLDSVQREDFETIQLRHFEMALRSVKPTVSGAELGAYTKWDDMFGTKPSEQSIAMMQSMRGAARALPAD